MKKYINIILFISKFIKLFHFIYYYYKNLIKKKICIFLLKFKLILNYLIFI